MLDMDVFAIEFQREIYAHLSPPKGAYVTELAIDVNVMW
jgi:hypothetical protein